ncbi:XylR family transcriptional regulator [Roseibacillus persicicus]|uniref:XylR family transcriptional regulator n=1 Tax=Roseibacillus persicicus TaxID=454148 RepID=A0A918WMP2_9BACT|nr:DNA-binding transcriptional regulator [Roseibacillus persicicus]MDQ8191567.1 DNA-binding transcriptional regulator [Roseibacillus persicicus]GHC57468.1 XylR family transcriptional regulator [Roseibacillus persicicus]
MSEQLRIAVLIETSRAYGRGIFHGIADYSRAHGPWSFTVQERDLRGGIPEWIQTWEGDGILCRAFNPELAELLAKAPCPVVDLYGRMQHPDIPWLDTNPDGIAKMAVEFYLNAAFTQFAYCGFHGLWFSDQREKAFVALLKKLGFPCSVYEAPANFENQDVATREGLHPQGSDSIREWVSNLPKGTAILACNDVRAQQLTTAAAAVGRKIPDDLAIMGVDNDKIICRFANPSLSSIEPDTRLLGYTGSAWLHRLIKGETLPSHSALIDPIGIKERTSTDLIASEDEIFVKALRFIRRLTDQRTQVEDVLKHVGRSRNTVESRFREILGHSIRDEITAARIRRARCLLQQTRWPLHKIAEASGFATTAHFCRAFKNAEKQTPTEFRSAGEPPLL